MPLLSSRPGYPVPVILRYLIAGWALSRHVGFPFLEMEADRELLEGKICHEAVFRKAETQISERIASQLT
jgi:hypothetical protein